LFFRVPISPPNPLGLTADQFAAAYSHLKGEKFASYRQLFRAGSTPQLPNSLPPISRELREASPEGEVIKFILPVGSHPTIPGATLETESVLIPMIGRSGAPTY